VRKAESDIDFDLNGVGLNPEDGGTAQAGEHDADKCKNRCPRLLADFSKDFDIMPRATSQIVRSAATAKRAESDD